MHALTFVCYVGVFTTSIIAYTLATVGGQYSVNVHFVPPLVTAPCQIAQFWSPPNVTCGLCFCMTGSLSRCIPQPGCRPNAQNSTTPNPNGNSTTPSPDESSASPPEGDTPTETPGAASESESSSHSSSTSSSVPGKLRAAKLGKSRRRRHSSASSSMGS